MFEEDGKYIIKETSATTRKKNCSFTQVKMRMYIKLIAKWIVSNFIQTGVSVFDTPN